MEKASLAVLLAYALSPWGSPSAALLLGIAFALWLVVACASLAWVARRGAAL